MLLGFHEHAIALMKYGMEGAPNWRMQQWAGLTVTALAFPELTGSEAFLQHALKGIQEEIDTEVYVDGVETEQTSGYDAMSANNFYQVLVTISQAGHQIPTAYSKAVENMFTYLAFSIDQSGYLPRNGDADFQQPWLSSNYKEIRRYDERRAYRE